MRSSNTRLVVMIKTAIAVTTAQIAIKPKSLQVPPMKLILCLHLKRKSDAVPTGTKVTRILIVTKQT